VRRRALTQGDGPRKHKYDMYDDMLQNKSKVNRVYIEVGRC